MGHADRLCQAINSMKFIQLGVIETAVLAVSVWAGTSRLEMTAAQYVISGAEVIKGTVAGTQVEAPQAGIVQPQMEVPEPDVPEPVAPEPVAPEPVA